MKANFENIFDEWLDYRETQELECAVMWFDGQLNDIESKVNAPKSHDAGNGKIMQMEACNQDFFRGEEMKDRFKIPADEITENII